MTHLFGAAPSVVLIRPETRVPAYMADFINRVAPGKVSSRKLQYIMTHTHNHSYDV